MSKFGDSFLSRVIFNLTSFHMKNGVQFYGIRSPHIFKKPGISIEITSISIETLGISTQKFWNTRFLHLEFEILGILSAIPSILKTWNFE